MDLLPKTIDGQLYFHYTQLHNWEKNDTARSISKANWTKLIDELTVNGIEDAFKIGEDGTVYDGNNRLKALRFLIDKEGIQTAHNGVDLEWIPVVVKHPNSEAEKWRYAFTRNEQFANWDEEGLTAYQTEWEALDLANINVNFKETKSIEQQLEDLETDTREASDKNDAEDTEVVKCPNCGHEFDREV